MALGTSNTMGHTNPSTIERRYDVVKKT